MMAAKGQDSSGEKKRIVFPCSIRQIIQEIYSLSHPGLSLLNAWHFRNYRIIVFSPTTSSKIKFLAISC